MSGRTRVKICGITRVQDMQMVANAGADAIGLVFYPPSPRAVDIARASELLANLPAFVTTTALFVDPQPQDVHAVIEALKIDLLQFHGAESPAFCRQFSRPYIKAIAMQRSTDLAELSKRYSDAKALLLDTYKPGVPGGTGETFNWQWVPKTSPLPLILAGGLHPENVGQAIEATGVWAVDVSGGVELTKGVKCAAKVQQFINHARVN